MVAGEDAEGLNPGEVPGPPRRTESDETSVDLEVGIGDQRKMLVAMAVEVEDDAVAPDEPGVQACSSRTVAIWLPPLASGLAPGFLAVKDTDFGLWVVGAGGGTFIGAIDLTEEAGSFLFAGDELSTGS